MRGFCGLCKGNKSPRTTETSATPVASRRESFLTSPKIIIVGGGVAGLACAVKLLEHGLKDVIILEAQERVGGRIHTVPFADNNVDMGAQWVHGETNNIVYEMVKLRELLETYGDIYVSFQCIRSNGEVMDDNTVQLLKDLLSDIFINRRSLMADFDGSFADFLKLHFFEDLKDEKFADVDIQIATEFFENFKKVESSESALGLEEISTRSFLEYHDCEGDYMLGWKEKGYGEFIRVLTGGKYATDLGALHKKIVYGARVKLIDWSREDGTVCVTCENMAELFIADIVVITVSLGVLKKCGESLFQPKLPEQKLTAIQNLGYGDVFKVFLEFPHKFWPAKWTGFTTLWREEDLEKLEKGLEWMQDIYGFYIVSYQPRVLQAWAVGKAVEFLERLPMGELKAYCMMLLQRFLPAWEIPDPVNVIASSWSTNKDFCGAYSFSTMQAEKKGTGAAALAIPLNTTLIVPVVSGISESSLSKSIETESSEDRPSRYTIKPTVLFAGEATSTHYFSTVHGAVESGFREAQRIVGYYEYETS